MGNAVVVVVQYVVDIGRLEVASFEAALLLPRIKAAALAAPVADHARAAERRHFRCHTKHLVPLHRMDKPEISCLSLYTIFSTENVS